MQLKHHVIQGHSFRISQPLHPTSLEIIGIAAPEGHWRRLETIPWVEVAAAEAELSSSRCRTRSNTSGFPALRAARYRERPASRITTTWLSATPRTSASHFPSRDHAWLTMSSLLV